MVTLLGRWVDISGWRGYYRVWGFDRAIWCFGAFDCVAEVVGAEGLDHY